MATELSRITLTKDQLRATEIVLYRAADLINRLLADNSVPYTKMPLHQPYPAPQGLVGVPPPVPITPATNIAPHGGY